MKSTKEKREYIVRAIEEADERTINIVYFFLYGIAKEEAAPAATNNEDGKAEKMPTQHNSASILTETKEGCQV